MQFDLFRERVLLALSEGRFQHATRKGRIETKNFLQVGKISAARVADIIRRSKPAEVRAAKHHVIDAIDIYIIISNGWYIKVYFLQDDLWFISVHPTER